jgi:hypothetical protein
MVNAYHYSNMWEGMCCSLSAVSVMRLFLNESVVFTFRSLSIKCCQLL